MTFLPRFVGPTRSITNTHGRAKACGRHCLICRAALAELHGLRSRRGYLSTCGEHFFSVGGFRACQARSQERITRRWSEPPPRWVVTGSRMIGRSLASASVTVGRRSLTLVVRRHQISSTTGEKTKHKQNLKRRN